MRTRFSQPASFWWENVIAVVILRRFLARMSLWREQVIKCKKFNYFAISGEGLTSFSINNSTNFFGENKK